MGDWSNSAGCDGSFFEGAGRKRNINPIEIGDLQGCRAYEAVQRGSSARMCKILSNFNFVVDVTLDELTEERVDESQILSARMLD